MKTTIQKYGFGAIATVIMLGASTQLHATIIQTNQNAGSATAFDSNIVSTDLINNGSSALLSVSTTGTPNGGTPLSQTTDGAGTGTYWQYSSNGSSWDVTYTFDTTSNTLGYDLTEINTFVGWPNSPNYGNQLHDIYYSLVGSPSTFVLLTAVNYQPFGTGGGAGANASWVSITENSSGILASGVKALLFTLKNNGGFDGKVIREFDVIGTATVVPEPGTFAMLLFGSVMLWAVRRKRR